MRIGVLTYHCPPNFGAQLQAVSTVGFLQKAGHEVFVLNWYPQDLEAMYRRRIPAAQIACHEQFTATYLPVTAKCQTELQLIDTIDSLCLDAIVAGSDALFKFIPADTRRHFSWRRLRYIYHFTPLSCELLDSNPFFGGFLSKLKRRIPASAYAVSSQNCAYHKMTLCERFRMRRAMSNYRLISTRDRWTQDMVRSITGRREVPVFPDPVFAFSANTYINIPTREEIRQKYGLQEKYLLFSFWNKRCPQELVRQIAAEAGRHGYQPVSLAMPEGHRDIGIAHTIDLPLSPIEWYSLIVNSDGYIGERMHPIVVCLHNAIPFFAFDEYGIKTLRDSHTKEECYNPLSSKTFQIVSSAGLLDNLHSYQGEAPLPTAQHVVECIEAFDVQRCRDFAHTKADEYRQGMARILDSLK